MKRKLTTILVADAQGYSTAMAADEAATLERLRRCRSIMAGLFQRYEGRQVNTWGDSVIAEFPSVVEAVRCAVEIQDALSGENRDLPKPRQMWFRIGINLGDVIIDGNDLYGDGVNVAARLEALAEPGGIVVSGTVYSLARKQLALAFDFAGEQAVKNLDEPVPSYRVRMSGRNGPDPTPVGRQDAHASAAPPPESRSAFARSASKLEALGEWLGEQPRSVRFSAFMVAFFFGINLLFGNIVGDPWFVFPSAPFALYIFLRSRRGRRGDRIAP